MATSTAQSYITQAKKLVGLQINPQLQALQQQANTTRTEGDAYANRAVNTYGGVSDAIKSLLNTRQAPAPAPSAEGQVQSLYSGAQQDLANNAATRGVAGTAPDLTAQARLAQQRASQDATAATNRSGATFQAGQNLLAAMSANALNRGADASRQFNYQTQKGLQDIHNKQTSIEGTRGGLEAQTLQDMQKTAFNQYVTQQGLHIKRSQMQNDYNLAIKKLIQNQDQFNTTSDQGQQKINETVTHDRNMEAAAQRRIDVTLRGQTLQHQAALARLVGKGQATPAQKLALERANGKIRSAVRSAYNMVGYYLQQKNKTTNKNYTVGEVKALLGPRFSNDTDIIQAAIDLRHYKALTPQTIQALKSRHIGIPAAWLNQTTYRGPANTSQGHGGART